MQGDLCSLLFWPTIAAIEQYARPMSFLENDNAMIDQSLASVEEFWTVLPVLISVFTVFLTWETGFFFFKTRPRQEDTEEAKKQLSPRASSRRIPAQEASRA